MILSDFSQLRTNGREPAFAFHSGPVRNSSAPLLQRARGRASIGVSCDDDQRTRVTELFQEGCLKLRLPRPELKGSIDVVILNTSGGLTGGDMLSVEIDLARGACATVTTPACERIYRSIGGEVCIYQRLHVSRGARLDWVPQETILFDRARLKRRFDIHLEGDAEILLAEAILFGRAAMGETVSAGFLCDRWTINRDGRVLFADALRISDPFDKSIASSASLRGCLAVATVIQVGRDLEAKRDALRAGFTDASGWVAGASMVGGVLVARIAASSGLALRAALIVAFRALRDCPLPRNWSC